MLATGTTLAVETFPSPLVGDQFHLTYYNDIQASSLELRLYDELGRYVQAQRVAVQPKFNLITLSAAGWAPGVYLLRLHVAPQLVVEAQLQGAGLGVVVVREVKLVAHQRAGKGFDGQRGTRSQHRGGVVSAAIGAAHAQAVIVSRVVGIRRQRVGQHVTGAGPRRYGAGYHLPASPGSRGVGAHGPLQHVAAHEAFVAGAEADGICARWPRRTPGPACANWRPPRCRSASRPPAG
ncbi:MAG: T9SS type A sorting domain-containing protein [Hymenobacter sp.]|nr:MAG: T9SS type A sorting domain-containing protein [Hymenobacter sp.]